MRWKISYFLGEVKTQILFVILCMPLATYHTRGKIEAGCDEAGRGCLAGPVFAAAVILPKRFSHPLLNDSKVLTEKQRDELRLVIEKKALSWAVGQVSELEIDRINILQSSFLAMHRALDRLQVEPNHLIIDGNRFKPYLNIPFTCVIKGDAKYQSIAAASILAKTYRDEHMQSIGETHPEYGWTQNKGYPTAFHRSAIRNFGTTKYHRMSFNLLGHPKQLEIFEDSAGLKVRKMKSTKRG